MYKQIFITRKEHIQKYLDKFEIYDLFLENVLKNKLLILYETSEHFSIILCKDKNSEWIPQKVVFPSLKFVLLERQTLVEKERSFVLPNNKEKYSNLHLQLQEVST